MTAIAIPAAPRPVRHPTAVRPPGPRAAKPTRRLADDYLPGGFKRGERAPVVGFASCGPGSLFELLENTRQRFGRLHRLEGVDLATAPVNVAAFTRDFYLNFQATISPTFDRAASLAASPEADEGPLVVVVREGRFVHADSYATPWRFEPAPGVDPDVTRLPLFTAHDVRRNVRELNRRRIRLLLALRDEDRREGRPADRWSRYGVNHERHQRRFWLGVFAERFEDRFDAEASARLSGRGDRGPIVLVMADGSRYVHAGRLASPWRFEGVTSDGPWQADHA